MDIASGSDINVIDKGAGPAVLLLHGNPDSANLWEDVMARLSRNFRCIAPDLPGFGDSTAADGTDYSLAGQAQFVQAVLSKLGITDPINVVGHDFGGTFALSWALQHRDRVARVAVMNTAYFADYRWHSWARIWRTPILGELSMATMNRHLFRHEMRRGSRALSVAHIDATYDRVSPSVKRAILRLYRAISPGSFAGLEASLKELGTAVPMLVVWGDNDPYIPDSYAERFPATKVVHFSGAGHWVPVVEAEGVARELADFFMTESPKHRSTNPLPAR